MIDIRDADSRIEVSYRCYLLPLSTLVIPPAMLYELGGALLAGSLSAGETVGLLLGIGLPLFTAAFFVEFAEFSFSRRDGSFRWQSRKLFRRRNGEIPLHRVVKIRREDFDASDLIGMHNMFRLLVILDDGKQVSLSRRFLRFQGRKVDGIVDQVREYLGHVTPMA